MFKNVSLGHLLLIVMLLITAGCAEKLVNSSSQPEPEPEPEPIPADAALVLFWLIDGTIPNNIELEQLLPTFNLLETDARISFQSSQPGYPNVNRVGSMERRNMPTEVNYLPEANNNIPFAEADMRGIQLREPFVGEAGEHELLFEIDASNMADLVLSLAIMDEGASDSIFVHYATDEARSNWSTEGLTTPNRSQSLTNGTYRRIVFYLDEAENVSGNPHLTVRLTFSSINRTENTGARVNFNNFAVHAVPLSQND
ncbi:MAG: hypothetical protein LAT67_12555 [Balneolales bacterium]|nr:hypothetical protein [Balneolales bacterium]